MYRPTQKKEQKPNTSDNNFSYELKNKTKKKNGKSFFCFAWLTDNLSYTNGWKNFLSCFYFVSLHLKLSDFNTELLDVKGCVSEPI